MEITYTNKRVEKYFTNFDVMKREKGSDLTRRVKKRLDALKAADNFFIFLSTGLGKPYPLTGNLQGKYAVHITRNVRLIVEPVSDQKDPNSLRHCKKISIGGYGLSW